MNKFIYLTIALYSTALGGSLRMPYTAPKIASSGTVSISCVSGCSDEMTNHLPYLVKKLVETENSQCFLDYFKGQKHIDEGKGMTGEQIVAKLKTSTVSTTLTVYYPNIFHRVFAKECGFDSSDGSISMKAGCYSAYDDCSRASFFGHEISHALGFTHFTAGNQAAGNEQTVPYLINSAFMKCCK